MNVKLRERVFFYIVFTILIILMLLMIESFFTVLVVSFISVIILKPVYGYILGLKLVKERKGLAASLTLLALFVVLIIPTFLIVRLAVDQLSEAFASLVSLDVDALIQDIQQSLPAGTQPLETNANEGVQPVVRSVAKAVADFAGGLVSSIPNMITQGVIFIVVVATVLPVYDTLMPKLEEISPLGDELSAIYNRKITAMIKSLVMGVFLIAILQGLAMGIVYWIAGLPYIFLLTLLSMLLAMIPMVGISWLVIGIAIVSFLTGNWQQAVIVLVGFYGVVNWIDILLRPKLLVEEASINFGLFMVSIFAGLAWAGAMGLFYGPVIMLLLVTTIQIYAERYANEDVDYLGKALNKLGGDGEADASASDAPEAEAGAEGKDSRAWPEPETSQEPDPEEAAELPDEEGGAP